jgi:hypothetical protein
MPSAYDIYTFYLEPEDLRGQSNTVTIETAKVEEIFNPRAKRNEKRIVVSFAGKKKVFPLNKTQAGALIEAAKTDDFSKWPGVQIIITPANTSNGKATITITPAPATNERRVDPTTGEIT